MDVGSDQLEAYWDVHKFQAAEDRLRAALGKLDQDGNEILTGDELIDFCNATLSTLNLTECFAYYDCGQIESQFGVDCPVDFSPVGIAQALNIDNMIALIKASSPTPEKTIENMDVGSDQLE